MPSDLDISPDGDGPSGHRDTRVIHCDTFDTISQGPSRNSNGDMARSPTLLPTTGPHQTRSSVGAGPVQEKEGKTRRRVKNFLVAATERLGTAVHNDDTEYQRGKARDWVEIPGERQRDERFPDWAELYNPPRDADGMATPVPPADQRSRAGSDASGSGARRASAPPGGALSPSSPPAAVVRIPHANTLPVNPTSFGFDDPSSAGPSRGRHQSLAVPSPVRRE
jgi:hypothetical protein